MAAQAGRRALAIRCISSSGRRPCGREPCRHRAWAPACEFVQGARSQTCRTGCRRASAVRPRREGHLRRVGTEAESADATRSPNATARRGRATRGSFEAPATEGLEEESAQRVRRPRAAIATPDSFRSLVARTPRFFLARGFRACADLMPTHLELAGLGMEVHQVYVHGFRPSDAAAVEHGEQGDFSCSFHRGRVALANERSSCGHTRATHRGYVRCAVVVSGAHEPGSPVAEVWNDAQRETICASSGCAVDRMTAPAQNLPMTTVDIRTRIPPCSA